MSKNATGHPKSLRNFMNTAPELNKPKRLVIKNFKVKPRLPENYQEDTWQKLHSAVLAIQLQKPVPYSLEELYQSCENLCHHQMAEKIYVRLKNACETRVKDERAGLERFLKDSTFLILLNQSWLAFCQQMLMIRSIFLYLDRTYVLQTKGLLSIWDMSLGLYREHILERTSIRQQSFQSILAEIDRERRGNLIDRSLLRSLIRMLIDLKLYAGAFEHQFIERTSSYYHNESHRLKSELAVPAYLNHVGARLRQESDRVSHYLDGYTRRALTLVVERECLAAHVPELLDKGFDGLMTTDDLEDLKLLYGLLYRVDALEQLRIFFSNYIKINGHQIVSRTEAEENMVQTLLEFKQKLDRIVNEAFVVESDDPSAMVTSKDWHERFQNTLKESFETFINRRHNKPAELIARFLDGILKQGNKASGDNVQVESLIDRVLILFRFVQGKDVFEAFYKKDLAKRLLLRKSASLDLERLVLAKLRAECGPEYTGKLEGMFKDMDVSKDIMSTFKESTMYTKLDDVELVVDVLTQGYWPTNPDVKLLLSPELNSCLKVFKDFYDMKHSGKHLKWQHSLGHCLLKGHFEASTYEIQVSLFQTVVLLCFNESESLGYAQIQMETGLDDQDLKRTLQSLACGKMRVINKSPKGKEIEDSDVFSFNSEFTSKLRRIKINQIQSKTNPEETARTHEQIALDRHQVVDAAIVRIMKTRKQLSHAQLMSQVFDALKFPLSAHDLKKRIESLIEKEYLKRIEQGYEYLA